MAADAAALGAKLAPEVAGTPHEVARLLEGIASSFHDYALAATRESEQRAELSRGSGAIVSVPHLGGDLTDLASVLELGRYLWGAR